MKLPNHTISFQSVFARNRCLVTAALVASLGFSLTANANPRDRYDTRFDDYDYARVVNVEPIFESYQVSEPVEQCYEERVPVQRHAHHSQKQSRTPEILGAIVGAAVGRQFGGGRGKDVATVAGAVLGGSIGRDIKNNSRDRYASGRYGNEYYRGAQYQTVSRCDVTQVLRTQEQVVGYDVSYEYQGKIYHTRMADRPGREIRVKVIVQPV